MSALRSATVEALDQMVSLIITAQGASTPTSNVYAESGIGPHVRHVVDHFRALEKGLESGVVDYNIRRRECALELRPDLALAEVKELRDWLQFLESGFQAVTVESEVSCLHQDIRRCESVGPTGSVHFPQTGWKTMPSRVS